MHSPLLEQPDQHSPQPCVPWYWVFYINVFFACCNFSIVMPSLFLYLSSMQASPTWYAVIVATYSVGEAFGAVALGYASAVVGTRRTMQFNASLSLAGSLSYAVAGSLPHGPAFVLLGRLLQGLGSGGQQAVEQAYISVNAPPEQRTAMTSRLSTFACCGFIFGPAIGAAIATIPAAELGPLALNSFTNQGWAVAVLSASTLASTTFLFREATSKHTVREDAEEWGEDDTPNVLAIWSLIALFFVHFNGFAIQETITTPLVNAWFGWKDYEASLLFTAAGAANLACAIALALLSEPRGGASEPPAVSDQVLLLWSLLVGLVGWLLMIPPASAAERMSKLQFGVAFSLITVAFPLGRSLCLSMVGRLLGDRPQGGWTGIMFAIGAIARMVGPFWAVAGYDTLGGLAVFGSSAALFGASLLLLRCVWTTLLSAPPPAEELRPATPPARGAAAHSPAAVQLPPPYCSSPMWHAARNPSWRWEPRVQRAVTGEAVAPRRLGPDEPAVRRVTSAPAHIPIRVRSAHPPASGTGGMRLMWGAL